MYCRNCGKEMNKSDKFCKECGKSALAETITQAENSSSTVKGLTNSLSNKDINFWGAIATSVILAILMFQKWVSIPAVSMLGYENYSKFSLFEILKGIENINNIISGNAISFVMAMAVIFILLSIVCLIMLAIFCYRLFSNSNGTGIGSAAMIIGIILSIVFILTMIIVNMKIENETRGYMASTFELTAIPFVMLILSMVGKFLFIRKLDEKNEMNISIEEISEEVISEEIEEERYKNEKIKQALWTVVILVVAVIILVLITFSK